MYLIDKQKGSVEMAGEDSAVKTELYIDGEQRQPTGNKYYSLHNPARPAELVGEAACASSEDVDAACEAAHAAFPAWALLSYAERADYLRKIAAHVTADEAELKSRIRLFTREHGKILKESTMELTRLGDRFIHCAGMAERLAADEELKGPPFDTIITRQPRGVAALIVPWNWPLSILGAKLPQALVSGNTCVVKPSQNSAMAPTLTLMKIAEMLPPGPRFSPAAVLMTNFFGLRELTQKLIAKMPKGGAIVNLTSGAGMGWAQNIPLLTEALAITDLDAVDEFVSRHEIHNDGINNQAAYPDFKATADRMDGNCVSTLERNWCADERDCTRGSRYSDTG